MVTFNHPYKDSKSLKIDYLFYFSSILLAAIIFYFLIFGFKINMQNKQINYIENQLLNLGKGQRQVEETKVLDYKQKINDFQMLLDNHKITSNVFGFIEDSTLANVWFYNFDMTQAQNELRLQGFSSSMDVLNNQVQAFEKKQNFVKEISILNAEADLTGKVNFMLDISFNPKIFNYEGLVEPGNNMSQSNQ